MPHPALLTRPPRPAELLEFRARRRLGSPRYIIYLGFGQDLSAQRPKEKHLVLVKVRLQAGGGGGQESN